MKVLAVVGTFGSGKTTVTLRTLVELSATLSRDKVAYLLNDEGTYLDGDLGNAYAQVFTMTNGCFTCGDTREVSDRLRQLEESGVQLVIMEGFGLISGYETLAFLTSTPYPFHIATLVDFQHFDVNKEVYEEVLASQIGVASLGVFVTRAPREINFLNFDKTPVSKFVVSKNRNHAPIHILKDAGISQSQIDQVLLNTSKGKPVQPCACKHHHHSHGKAEQASDHVVNHGHYMYSFELQATATLENIRTAFGSVEGVVRIKGAVGGKKFNMVHGTWNVEDGDTRNYFTVYSRQPIDISQLGIIRLIQNQAESFDNSAESYTLLRQDSGSESALRAEISRLLKGIPLSPVVTKDDGGNILITHPETLQTVKELSRRPSVKDTEFVTTLGVCLQYWLTCVHWLKENEQSIAPKRLSVNKVELGVSIAWWVSEFESKLDAGLVAMAKSFKIGELVAEGALGYESINSDPKKAYWQMKELEKALRFGKTQGDDGQKLNMALTHFKKLSERTALEGEWSAVTL